MQTIEELGEQEAGLAIAAIREELVRRGKVAVIAVSDSTARSSRSCAWTVRPSPPSGGHQEVLDRGP